MSSLKDQILECVLTHDWVSFAQLARIPGFADPSEDGLLLEHAEFDNMIIWSGTYEQRQAKRRAADIEALM